MVKNPIANAGDAGDSGLIPGSGRSLKEEMATHSSIFAWKNPMGRGAWQTTVHRVSKVRCDRANEHVAQFNKAM